MRLHNPRRTAATLALSIGFAGTLWRFGAAAPVARAEPELSPFVFVPGPPQYIAGPKVVAAAFSGSGRYVFLNMTDPETREDEAAREAEWKPGAEPEPGVPDLHLVLWNRRTRRAAVSWTAPWKGSWFQRLDWLPGTDIALATVASGKTMNGADGPAVAGGLHLIQLDPRRGTGTERVSVANGPVSTFLVSPKLPVAVVLSGGEDPGELRVVRADSVSDALPLPEGSYSYDVHWSADGATFYLPYHGAHGKEMPEKPIAWQALDTRTATLRSVSRLPDGSTRLTFPKVTRPPFTLYLNAVPVRDGRRAFTAQPLWLDNGGKALPARFLLHANARQPSVSPANDAVLYLADGMAFLRPLRRETRSAYEERTATAIRAMARNNARQVAIALQSYSADYNDTLPPPDLVKDAVDPLLRSREVWEVGEGTGYGFVYAPPGGPVESSLKGATPMGYYPAPGGRYVVYMDGRIEWEPSGR